MLCVAFGEIQRGFPFSQVSTVKTKSEPDVFLGITWLLEGLSKQSLGFVNSQGYLAIKASRWRLSRTTCYGNAFALRTEEKYPKPGSPLSPCLSMSLSLAPSNIHKTSQLTRLERG